MHEPSDFFFFGKTTIMSALPDKRQHKPTKRFGEEAEPTTSSKQQKTSAAKSTAKAKSAKPIAPPKKSAINRSPSVKVEEINDPADQPKSNPPHNPAHILEREQMVLKTMTSPLCIPRREREREQLYLTLRMRVVSLIVSLLLKVLRQNSVCY